MSAMDDGRLDAWMDGYQVALDEHHRNRLLDLREQCLSRAWTARHMSQAMARLGETHKAAALGGKATAHIEVVRLLDGVLGGEPRLDRAYKKHTRSLLRRLQRTPTHREDDL